MTVSGSVIASQLEAWGAVQLPNERALFGTEDPDEIAGAVDEWCAAQLGSGIARYLFFDSSSGSVHGVELTDGRRVVVKGHRPTIAREYLAAVAAVQGALATAGYPAPRPIIGPAPCRSGHLTAEEHLEQARPADAHDPGIRRLLASGLARFIELASPHHDDLAAVTHPMARVLDGLYPAPHSERFDFAATAEGAEWIDELAREARRSLTKIPAGRAVVAHGDWRVQNVGIRAGAITAVYDWDSVSATDECTALAAAATTFSVDWSIDQPRRLPTPAEAAAFLDDYASARGDPFSVHEQQRLAASIVASLAYGARCEHADPGLPPTRDDSQRALLAALGPGLLADGLGALTNPRG